MAGQKQHDFHLVEPSPWPFFAAVGAFVMLIGAVRWMNGLEPWLFFIGLAAVLYVSYAWWADVTKESNAGDHTPVVQIGLRYGMILFIMSEVMFFAAWFWMYAKHAIYPMVSEAFPQGGVWPPEGIEIVDPWHLPLLNTVILLTSGATVTWAHHAVMEGDRKGVIAGLTLTVLLGLFFSAVQAYEYAVIPWGLDDTIYGASFYVATGFHGLHVIIGTIFLFVVLMFALKDNLTPERHIAFESAAWYWHFVDVVWLFLFILIYVGSAAAVG